MSADLLAPEFEMFPGRYRWTAVECYRLVEEGRLVGRYELLDGEVISKMRQKPPHSVAIVLVVEWLMSLFGMRCVRAQAPITLADPLGIYNEPEPDVVVTREPTTAETDRHPGPEDIVLLAEVADSSLRGDLIVKSRLYALAGIAEYWVLDLNGRQLHVHTMPEAGEYTARATYGETDSVATAARPGAKVAVARLLPRSDAG